MKNRLFRVMNLVRGPGRKIAEKNDLNIARGPSEHNFEGLPGSSKFFFVDWTTLKHPNLRADSKSIDKLLFC